MDAWVSGIRMKLVLIPNMMYLPVVYTKTQFKTKSLKPREGTIKETSREWHVRIWLWIS